MLRNVVINTLLAGMVMAATLLFTDATTVEVIVVGFLALCFYTLVDIAREIKKQRKEP